MISLTHKCHRISNALMQKRAQLSQPLSSLKDTYGSILVSTHSHPNKPSALGVGLIELNQPKSLNSLSDALFNDLIHASIAFDSMDEIGAIVVTGKGKAFAAGADIPEMITKDFAHETAMEQKLSV